MKNREDFIRAVVDIAEYWKDKPNASFGTAFSILVMFDGDSSVNDFNEIKIKGITNGGYLHEDFCAERERRENERK